MYNSQAILIGSGNARKVYRLSEYNLSNCIVFPRSWPIFVLICFNHTILHFYIMCSNDQVTLCLAVCAAPAPYKGYASSSNQRSPRSFWNRGLKPSSRVCRLVKHWLNRGVIVRSNTSILWPLSGYSKVWRLIWLAQFPWVCTFIPRLWSRSSSRSSAVENNQWLENKRWQFWFCCHHMLSGDCQARPYLE